MLRQHPALLHDAENEERIDCVASVAEPPPWIAEPNLFHAVLSPETPRVVGIAWNLSFHAILRSRLLNEFELRMGGEHLVMHAADPMLPRSDLAVRYGKEKFAERRT